MTTTAVVAIKSDDGEWLLDVRGVPFGSPTKADSDGQYFDEHTALHLDKYPTVPAVYYHGFDENGRPAGEPAYIGKTLSYEVKPDGVWFRVALDKANAYAKRIWEAAKRGVAKASSGSIVHLARWTRDGHITQWPVAELTLIDAEGKRQPANQYAVALPVIKAVYDRAGLNLPDDIEGDADQPWADAEGAQQSAPAAKSAEPTDTMNNQSIGGIDVDTNEIQQMIADALKAQRDADEAKRKEDEAVQTRIDAALKAQKDAHDAEVQALKADAAAGRRLPGWETGDAPNQTQFGNLAKYDGLDADDMGVLFGVAQAAKSAGKGNGPSENLRKAIAVRLAEKTGAEDVQYRAAKSAMKMAGIAAKSNEINQSTLSNYGDEWIGVLYSTQLWDKIRLATPIAAKLPTVVVPQGSESVVLPLEGTSPTFYKVAQAADLAATPGRPSVTFTSSQLGSASKTLTVSKMGAIVNYSGELDEDSLIPWAQELRKDLTNEGAEILEHLLIDGDTDASATTNINHIGGTPAATAVYLLMNGFRKSCLITTTANSRSAGGAFAITDFIETVKLMGLGGRNAVDKQAVGFIIDMWTAWASLNLAEVKTRDVFVAPTVENGVLRNVYGYDVYASANMHRANQDATYGLKANTAGKTNLTTASANTTGAILAVRWDQWRLGFKRQMTFEIARDAFSDSTAIVASMRVGLVQRDTEASAITYNVAV